MGLIPSWSKDGKGFTINSRMESLTEKPMFKKLIETQRCVVPSTGFYEWKRDGKYNEPYYIGLKDHGFIGFAGLYDEWENPKGGTIKSYVIITCPPNKVVEPIHNRMPAILNKEDQEAWLNPDTVEPERLLPLLKPYQGTNLIAYTISSRVNSPVNNDEKLDEPAKETLF